MITIVYKEEQMIERYCKKSFFQHFEEFIFSKAEAYIHTNK